MTGDRLRAAFERALAAAPGRLAEPFEAYGETATENGLTIRRSEGTDSAVAVRSVEGARNALFCGFQSRLAGKSGLRVTISGSDNVVFVGPHASVAGTDLDICGDGNLFYVGAFASIGRMNVALRSDPRGPGGRIVIGDHAMLATRIVASNADAHGLYDRASGARLNPNADVLIGDHVWIGRDTRILKGTCIGRDAIVGQGSLVSGALDEACVYAGVPARRIREGITWSRMDAESLDAMTASSRHRQFLRRVEQLDARIARFADGKA